MVGSRLTRLLGDHSVLACADGVVTARGLLHGTDVLAFETDASKQGGALGVDSCRAIAEITDQAVRESTPVIGIWHSGGARLREGVAGLTGVADVFRAQVRASGRVPQISVVVGPAAGGAAYGPALTDLVIMAPAGRVLVTGPNVVKAVTGQDVDLERLGGPETHARTGVAHVVATSEEDAFRTAGVLMDLVCRQGEVDGHHSEGSDPRPLVPLLPRHAYDVRTVVAVVMDTDTFVELQPRWAPNLVIGVARLGGRSVGVVANNPNWLAGCLDAASGDKAARFVQWCDSAGLPLVLFVDTPGYLPGVDQEDAAIVRRGAKLLHAYAACVVPRFTVVLRKSFGGAFIAMGSKGLGADLVLAWPGATIDVMGALAAVEVLHRREIAAVIDVHQRAELVRSLAAAHESSIGGLASAVASGAVDEIVEPRATRSRLLDALGAAAFRRATHRNPPL